MCLQLLPGSEAVLTVQGIQLLGAPLSPPKPLGLGLGRSHCPRELSLADK